MTIIESISKRKFLFSTGFNVFQSSLFFYLWKLVSLYCTLYEVQYLKLAIGMITNQELKKQLPTKHPLPPPVPFIIFTMVASVIVDTISKYFEYHALHNNNNTTIKLTKLTSTIQSLPSTIALKPIKWYRVMNCFKPPCLQWK